MLLRHPEFVRTYAICPAQLFYSSTTNLRNRKYFYLKLENVIKLPFAFVKTPSKYRKIHSYSFTLQILRNFCKNQFIIQRISFCFYQIFHNFAQETAFFEILLRQLPQDQYLIWLWLSAYLARKRWNNQEISTVLAKPALAWSRYNKISAKIPKL